jgi:hypothetical protein
VNNELLELRTKKKIPAREMVDEVRKLFPQFDKPLLSKCQYSDLYGVLLRDEAMTALKAKFAPESVATASNRKDSHRLKCRISCRLEDEEFADLWRYIRADGYDTMQSWLAYTVRRYIKRKKDREK